MLIEHSKKFAYFTFIYLTNIKQRHKKRLLLSSYRSQNLGNEPLNFELSWDEIVLNFFIFSTSVPSWEPGQPKPMSLTVPSVEKEIKAQMKKMKTAQPLKHRHQLFHLSKIHWKTSVSLSLTVLMPIHLNFIQGDFTRYKSWSREICSANFGGSGRILISSATSQHKISNN